MVNNGDAFQDELDVMYERVTFAGSYANKVDSYILKGGICGHRIPQTI